MSLQISSFFKQSALPTTVAGIAALTLVAGSASSVAVAQDATDDDDVEYEWEPGEGKHVEEWYDPSDWFNQDDVTDYEELGDRYENRDDMARFAFYSDTGDMDGYSGTYGGFDFDAYYDGYYDGYNDDSFGYDSWDAAWDSSYSTYYTAGYADGFYDSQTGYGFDAYYYVYPSDSTADGGASDSERANDPTRKRGDRQMGKSAPDGKQNARDNRGSRDGNRDHADRRSTDRANDGMASRTRVRGDVSQIALTGTERVDDKRHTTGRLRFADGREFTVDFGPYVNEDNLNIDRGDTITVIGKYVQRDGERVLRASRLTDAGITYMFAGPKRDVLKKDTKDGKKTYEDWNTHPAKDGSDGKSGN